MTKGKHMAEFGKVNRERVEKGLPKLKRSEYFTNPKPKVIPKNPRKKKEIVQDQATAMGESVSSVSEPMPEAKEFEDQGAV